MFFARNTIMVDNSFQDEKLKVLVVDDDKGMLFLLKKVLCKYDYEVFTASSAEEALELLKMTTPHIIISDIMMPGMDGFEFCKKVKEDERFEDVEFIFLTAKDASEYEAIGLDIGADDFIEKPFCVDRFIARLNARKRKVLRKKSKGEISGKIDNWNLTDVLQMLEMGRKTGRMNIVSDGKSEIWIELLNGEIVNAGFGKKRGREALKEIFRLKTGSFYFDSKKKVKKGKEEPIKISHILLNTMKEIDEENEERKRENVISKLKKSIWET